MIAPLLLIPFIENSFKHGASKMLADPYVKLRLSVENEFLHFFLTNSRPAIPDAIIAKGNIGLKNVMKRLQLLYPSEHELDIIEKHTSYTVFLRVRLIEARVKPETDEIINQVEEYAKA